MSRKSIYQRIRDLEWALDDNASPFTNDELAEAREAPAKLNFIAGLSMFFVGVFLAIVGALGEGLLSSVEASAGADNPVVQGFSGGVSGMFIAAIIFGCMGLLLTWSKRNIPASAISTTLLPEYVQMFGHLEVAQLAPSVLRFLTETKRQNRGPVVSEQYWLVRQQASYNEARYNEALPGQFPDVTID